jgi:hypothetical protein
MSFKALLGTSRSTRRRSLLLALLLPGASLAAQGRATGTFGRGPLRLVLTDSSFRAMLGEELGAAGSVGWRGDSMIVVSDTAGPRACAATATGTYAVALRGDSLRFTTITEPCTGRRGVFAGGPFVKSSESIRV